MYCITSGKKIKTRQQINSAAEHNFRISIPHNVDGKRSSQNQILVNSLGVEPSQISSLQKKLTDYYDGLGVKEKKDNVLMLEFIATASPEFFEGKTQNEIKEWADHQVNFFKNEFGEQIKLAILHLDEKTPHLHFMIGTEHKTVKRYKNQKGEFFKEGYSLNAKRYNPVFFTEFQDRFAKSNEVFGLKRGKKKAYTKKTKLKDYYENLAQQSHKLDEAIDAQNKWESFKAQYPKIKAHVEDLFNVIDSLVGILKTKELEPEEEKFVDFAKAKSDKNKPPAKKQPKSKVN